MQRRTLSARQALALDLVLVVVAGATGLYRDLFFDPSRLRMFDLPWWCYVTVQVLGAVALLWRRRHPVRIVWVNAALCLVSPTQASYVAVYSLGAHARRTALSAAAFATLLACWVLGAQQWRLVDPVTSLVLLVCALLLGLWVQARRSLLDSLTERAERAERERNLATALEGARYRARLAADVHDTVGHWVSLMVLQAGALTVSTREEGTRRAAETIETHGGRVIAELRDLLQRLRDDGVPPDGALENLVPDDASLVALVARAQQAGLSVTSERRGHPRPESSALAEATYRIVQEGLTNASQHAPGSDVAVVIDQQPNQTVVEVFNTGGATSTPKSSRRPDGSGLHGIRRRVELLGGHVDAGSLDDGGFRLQVAMPTTPQEARELP